MSKLCCHFIVLTSLFFFGLQNAHAQHYLSDLEDFIDNNHASLVYFKQIRRGSYQMRSNAEKNSLNKSKILTKFRVGKHGEVSDEDFAKVQNVFLIHSDEIRRRDGPADEEKISLEEFEREIEAEIGKYEPLKFVSDEGARTFSVLDEEENPIFVGLPLDENGSLSNRLADDVKDALNERFGQPEQEAPERPVREEDPEGPEEEPAEEESEE